MSQYLIVNESTEDTLETADTFSEAVRLAQNAAQRGAAGDLVSVLASDGKSVAQFVLLPDGTVQEQPIVRSSKTIDVSNTG